MAIKIAITNEKGGCGKTTTSVNLAAILSERGYRVLLVDADGQSYATYYYGLHNTKKKTIENVFFDEDFPMDAIIHTKFGVDVIPSGSGFKQAEEMLTKQKISGTRYQNILKNKLTAIETEYDFILIDCPPQGYKILDSIETFVDYLILPMIPDDFALHSLQVKAESVSRIRRSMNPRLRVLGALIIMDERNGTKSAYKEALQAQQIIPCFETTIRKNVTLSRAINAHEPINVYAKRSNGNVDYQAFADEVVRRVTK